MKLEVEATRVHFGLIEDLRRINLLRGGTRSSKSYSVMQLIFIWLFTGRIGKHVIKNGNFLIVRATMPALKATVMKDWNAYLLEMGMYGRIDHRKTVNEYHYHNRSVEFLSVDDEEKLKGRQSSMFWINEGDGVSFDTFMQLLMRCKKYCWIDINPSNSDSWIRSHLEDDRRINKGDVSLHISTYFDNPYLNEEMVAEIEGMKEVDPEYYKIYTLGEWAKLTGKIFTRWDIIDDDAFPDDLKTGYGLDFGFSNDPTALIKIAYDLNERKIYVDQLIYKRELLNSQIIEYIKENCNKTHPVVADSAEPKSIKELQTKGIRCIPALKGKDSIKHGIQNLKQFEILVTASSIDTIQELQRYKWKLDSVGDPLNEPIDKFNHSIDAIRYFMGKVLTTHKLKIG
jgi:phage terminase large subunit